MGRLNKNQVCESESHSAETRPSVHVDRKQYQSYILKIRILSAYKLHSYMTVSSRVKES